MATRRKPLPYAAEALRKDAVSELTTVRTMLKEMGIAVARGDAPHAIRLNMEALDTTQRALDTLNDIARMN